jgi:hypothetical protein
LCCKVVRDYTHDRGREIVLQGGKRLYTREAERLCCKVVRDYTHDRGREIVFQGGLRLFRR